MEETRTVATGKDIIVEITRAMRENVEELMYSTVTPSRFSVCLHPSDYQRLEGILPVILEQARRALDQEVEAWNEKAKPAGLLGKWLGGEPPRPPIEARPDGWDIRFEPDTNEELAPGDIEIISELTVPVKAELEGSSTRRITTRRHGDQTSSRQEVVPAAPAAQPGATSGGTVLATLTYDDRRGRQRVSVTGNQLVIGRGGVGYWVDVKVEASADVSREHVRIRRDEATGQFFLKDLSTLGTTLDGVAVPSSIETVDGAKRDKQIEVPLPRRARIGLANVIDIEFEAGGGA